MDPSEDSVRVKMLSQAISSIALNTPLCGSNLKTPFEFVPSQMFPEASSSMHVG